MSPKRRVTISKFLSKHLRHDPEGLGLTLEPGGWVPVADRLAACLEHGYAITRTELDEVVTSSDKQRFAFDETGQRIRANQGHSTNVDLQLAPTTPPAVLYHGTGAKNVAAIQTTGLLKMARHHVHLSKDIATAVKVGQRHGKPVVFIVDAAAMHEAGCAFYCSTNGVWLTDTVAMQYLRILDSPATEGV